jgi:hypothetical protein
LRIAKKESQKQEGGSDQSDVWLVARGASEELVERDSRFDDQANHGRKRSDREADGHMLDGMKRADFRPESGIFRELNLEQIVLNPDWILFLLHRKPCPVP